MNPAPLLLVTSLPPEEEVAWLALLVAAMPGETIVTPALCRDRRATEIAIVANPPPGTLGDLPRLRFIQSLWAGVDRLLADATVPAVPIIRLVDPALARTMAEAVAAVVLHLHRDLPLYAAQQRRREWRPHPAPLAADRCVTILGLGEMGRAAATLLSGLGFAARGWSRSGPSMAGVETYAGADGFAPALAGADILVNLLPLTRETRSILSRATFAPLAPHASIVNFGRGGHLNEADLIEALDSGRLRHAVLDVFHEEPLPPEHRLWGHPDITILPHVSAPTTKTTAAAIVAGTMATFRATGRLPPAVDRERGY